MFKKLNQFIRAEDGAVTVDWVVLTAAIVGLGIAVLVPIGNATTGTTSGIATSLASTDVGLDWTGS